MRRYWTVTEYANHSRRSILHRTTIFAPTRLSAKNSYRRWHHPPRYHHITASLHHTLNQPLSSESP